LYAGGNIVNFYYGYVNGLLQGRGDVSAANKVVIITRGGMLLLSMAALTSGYGLEGLGAAALLASCFGRWVAMRYYNRGLWQSEGLSGTPRGEREVIKTLWPNASRLGLVQVGAFLIQRANVLLASSFLGLSAAASYSMTLTLLLALSGVSTVVLQVRMPRMATSQAAQDRKRLRSLFGEILVTAWLTYLIGLTVLLMFGDTLLHAIASKTPLLPTPALALLGAIMLLELNHSVAASYLTTKNQVPFLWAGLLSGVAITGLSFALVTPFQAWGLIAAQGLVQLAYNNWKWPFEVRRDLDIGWLELFGLGLTKVLRRQVPQNTGQNNTVKTTE
jgi:O-antigen/teichoic acid export membrane protein